MASGNILATKGDFLNLRTCFYLLAWTRNLMRREKKAKITVDSKIIFLAFFTTAVWQMLYQDPDYWRHIEEHVGEIPDRCALTFLVTE